MSNDVDEFLEHFGVKGMKWGVHKTPEDRTAAKIEKLARVEEKRTAKAAPFRAKGAEARQQMQEVTSQGLRSPLLSRVYGDKAADSSNLSFFVRHGKTKTAAIASAQQELQKKIIWADKNAEAHEQGKLTPGQKKAIIGASVGIGLAVATTGLAIYGNKKLAPIIARQNLSETRGITAEFGGGDISYEKFMKNVGTSMKASWGNAEHIARVGSTKLEDIDIQLPKGTQFTRVSTVAEKAVQSGNYAAFLPEDVTRYRAAFTNEKAYASQLYNVKIDTLSDIRVPSLKKRVDTFVELLDSEDAKYKVYNGPTKELFKVADGKADLASLASGLDKINARDYLKRYADTVKEQEFIRTATSRQLAEKYYSKVAGGNFGSDPLSKEFADRILKKGYHAIVDDMDAGVYGDKPMVLLDHTVFKVASAEPLTKEMIQQARETMTEVIGRKY